MNTQPERLDPATSSDRPDGAARPHVGWTVAVSLMTGLVAGLLLVVAPFIEPEERDVTGGLLLGFAIGWALLALLSVRFSDQPQRWAAAPAALMGVGGIVLIVFGPAVHGVLDWLWPPALLALVVWMFVSARRQLRSRSRRWLVHPVLAVLAISSLGGAYETVGEALDARTYSMPGRLVAVGDHQLHVHCTGTGSPTVVVEPGAGDFAAVLGWIAPVVAQDTRVCVYDRAGRGWSEPADSPQDATRIAADLRTVLRKTGVPGPYVLAGHSFGGLYVLTYAADHPDDVAGMVLVDSTAPRTPSGKVATSSGLANRVTALLSSSARLGVWRLVNQFAYDSLPPRSRDEATATGSTASTIRSSLDEYVQANASTGEAGALTDFGDKPLVVLTAGDGNDAAWQAKQERLAALSTNSAHRVVDGAVHASFVYEKKDAAETTRAILDVVSAVRSSGSVR
jgi:pimeloyl-ACP methyl ester carboxylesterase/uncharacterized membrane protein (UPF0136 family)